MAATVKTLLLNHGELYWGTRQADPGYHYGLSLDVGADGLTARIVYLMTDFDDDDEPMVTPDVLMSCYTVQDLEANGVVISDLMGEDQDPPAKGWYCIEESFFPESQVDALGESSAQLGGYLDIVLEIMLISPEEVAAGMPSLDEISFFDLLDEMEGITEKIDAGALQKPLPFSFRLIGDALLGWQFAD